jgi:uncharacterized metal-binding protein YceD (DUF177 family)
MAIKINIGTLNEGYQQIGLSAGFRELGLTDNVVKENVDISLELFKSIHQLDIKVKISGFLWMDCDRCLEEFYKPFESEFEIVYVQKAAREDEIDEDYIRTYNPFMKTIDLTNDIKEMIILSVPMKKLPDENKDGSCSWCGKTKDYWNSIIIDEDELKSIDNN